MSKNRYSLPFKNKWYVEFGGLKEKDWHDPLNINQRYAYDFEIRVNNCPYHDDYMVNENYYSYNQEIIAPLDGVVVDIQNLYEDTHIAQGRKVTCDIDDVRGNYILLKHEYNEYSLIAHIKKDSFKVDVGDIVKRGQPLANVGNSGNTNGAHIHFQVQDRYDYDNAVGIPITFKHINVYKENGKKRRFFPRYIKSTETVENKAKMFKS